MNTTGMQMISVLASAAVVLLAIAVDPASAEQLTLDQAIGTALANNPALKAADAQVAAAKATVLRSSSGFLPAVNLTETYSKTDNPLMAFGVKLNQEIVAQADFSPAAINHPEAIENYNTRLSVVQPVFNGGREYIAVGQAKRGRDAAVFDRNRTRQETVFGVIKAYYGVLLAREYYSVALRSLETSGANVKLADARFRAGAVLQSDLLRAKVQYAEVKEMATRAENGIKLALANLNFSMGVPQDREYEVEGSLGAEGYSEDVQALIAEALELRPDLQSLGLNRKNAESSLTMARTGYVPTINVMGQADWNSSDLAGDDAKSWAVMAVLQWNLFDGLVTQSRVNEASAGAARMRALEEQTRAAVQLQVRQAYYALVASRDRIAATASSVHEAEEGLRIVQRRYEAGMTTFVDVLGAESALIRARTNALQALYDNNIANGELKLAMGTL